MAKKKPPAIQYAALPYLIEDGHPRVLLVTSRETRRWILPKGKPEKKLAPHAVAAHEAYEEAGVKGEVAQDAFAAFMSTKRLPSGQEIPCEIRVFLLQVGEILPKWPEMHERERRWASPGEAALLSSEPGLIDVLLTFSGLWE